MLTMDVLKLMFIEDENYVSPLQALLSLTEANAETESPEIVCSSPLCRRVIICGNSSKECAIE